MSEEKEATTVSDPVQPVVRLHIHDDWGSPKLTDENNNSVNSADYFVLIDGEEYHLQGCIVSGGSGGHGMGAIPTSGFNAVRILGNKLETKRLARGSEIECIKKAT